MAKQITSSRKIYWNDGGKKTVSASSTSASASGSATIKFENLYALLETKEIKSAQLHITKLSQNIKQTDYTLEAESEKKFLYTSPKAFCNYVGPETLYKTLKSDGTGVDLTSRETVYKIGDKNYKLSLSVPYSLITSGAVITRAEGSKKSASAYCKIDKETYKDFNNNIKIEKVSDNFNFIISISASQTSTNSVTYRKNSNIISGTGGWDNPPSPITGDWYNSSGNKVNNSGYTKQQWESISLIPDETRTQALYPKMTASATFGDIYLTNFVYVSDYTPYEVISLTKDQKKSYIEGKGYLDIGYKCFGGILEDPNDKNEFKGFKIRLMNQDGDVIKTFEESSTKYPAYGSYRIDLSKETSDIPAGKYTLTFIALGSKGENGSKDIEVEIRPRPSVKIQPKLKYLRYENADQSLDFDLILNPESLEDNSCKIFNNGNLLQSDIVAKKLQDFKYSNSITYTYEDLQQDYPKVILKAVMTVDDLEYIDEIEIPIQRFSIGSIDLTLDGKKATQKGNNFIITLPPQLSETKFNQYLKIAQKTNIASECDIVFVKPIKYYSEDGDIGVASEAAAVDSSTSNFKGLLYESIIPIVKQGGTESMIDIKYVPKDTNWATLTESDLIGTITIKYLVEPLAISAVAVNRVDGPKVFTSNSSIRINWHCQQTEYSKIQKQGKIWFSTDSNPIYPFEQKRLSEERVEEESFNCGVPMISDARKIITYVMIYNRYRKYTDMIENWCDALGYSDWLDVSYARTETRFSYPNSAITYFNSHRNPFIQFGVDLPKKNDIAFKFMYNGEDRVLREIAGIRFYIDVCRTNLYTDRLVNIWDNKIQELEDKSNIENKVSISQLLNKWTTLEDGSQKDVNTPAIYHYAVDLNYIDNEWQLDNEVLMSYKGTWITLEQYLNNVFFNNATIDKIKDTPWNKLFTEIIFKSYTSIFKYNSNKKTISFQLKKIANLLQGISIVDLIAAGAQYDICNYIANNMNYYITVSSAYFIKDANNCRRVLMKQPKYEEDSIVYDGQIDTLSKQNTVRLISIRPFQERQDLKESVQMFKYMLSKQNGGVRKIIDDGNQINFARYISYLLSEILDEEKYYDMSYFDDNKVFQDYKIVKPKISKGYSFDELAQIYKAAINQKDFYRQREDASLNLATRLNEDNPQNIDYFTSSNILKKILYDVSKRIILDQ